MLSWYLGRGGIHESASTPPAADAYVCLRRSAARPGTTAIMSRLVAGSGTTTAMPIG
jgi:hypothetical protein